MKDICLRCGHKWVRRTEARPAQCPRCKSYNWDIPKSKIRCSLCKKEIKDKYAKKLPMDNKNGFGWLCRTCYEE